MEHLISNYRLQSIQETGSRTEVLFASVSDGTPSAVLELNNIAGFISFATDGVSSFRIDIREGGGSYGADLAIQLQRPELLDFFEVIIFKADTVEMIFRAVAERWVWRDSNKQPAGDVN